MPLLVVVFSVGNEEETEKGHAALDVNHLVNSRPPAAGVGCADHRKPQVPVLPALH